MKDWAGFRFPYYTFLVALKYLLKVQDMGMQSEHFSTSGNVVPALSCPHSPLSSPLGDGNARVSVCIICRLAQRPDLLVVELPASHSSCLKEMLSLVKLSKLV